MLNTHCLYLSTIFIGFVLESWCYSCIESPLLQDYVFKIICIVSKIFKGLKRVRDLINATLVPRSSIYYPSGLGEISTFNVGCL